MSGHTSAVKLPSKSAFWLGLKKRSIFPSNLPKCLKWLQKAYSRYVVVFSAFFLNFSFGAPVNSDETFYYMPIERLVAVAFDSLSSQKALCTKI